MADKHMIRPHSLAEIARRHIEGEQDWNNGLAEFLDTFYLTKDAGKRAAMLVEEPPRFDTIPDAYLAGVAEHLALRYNLPAPAWTGEDCRILHRPYFASPFESHKAILLAESPVAFRRRMIFVSHDPLSRASRHAESSQYPGV